jgi:hypothetical protein
VAISGDHLGVSERIVKADEVVVIHPEEQLRAELVDVFLCRPMLSIQ